MTMTMKFALKVTRVEPCQQSGQDHVEEALITDETKHTFLDSLERSITDLITMQKNGAAFEVAVGPSETDRQPAEFKACICGSGYILETRFGNWLQATVSGENNG
jgi:hypothetical protein